jgi:hypothetical protein
MKCPKCGKFMEKIGTDVWYSRPVYKCKGKKGSAAAILMTPIGRKKYNWSYIPNEI